MCKDCARAEQIVTEFEKLGVKVIFYRDVVDELLQTTKRGRFVELLKYATGMLKKK